MNRLAARGLPRLPLSCLRSLAVACAAAACLALPASAGTGTRQMAGVQSHVLWFNVDSAEMDRQLDHMKELGAGITRVDVGWSSIEHEAKGRYEKWYLDRLDHLVAGANARGIKLLLMLAETPCWASSAPQSLKQGCTGQWWHREVQDYPPRDASDYADALAFVIKRYGDQVYSYEIWNEPNQDYFFHTSDPVGDYARMVRAAYAAAKAADPRPIIVAGSLSDSDFEFTDALYRHGIKGYFDAFSVHPYSQDRSPRATDVETPRYSFAAGIPAVHAVMRRHGDDKPLWLTEFGWSTCKVRGQLHWQNCVDPSVQASYLQSAFRLVRSWSYVPVGIWFNLKNTTGAPDDRTGNYGLLGMDDSRKPAFAAFHSVARELQSGPVAAPPSAPRPAPKPRIRRACVHAARRGGYVAVTGRAPRRGPAHLLVYRLRWGTRAFARRPTYSWRFTVRDSHRFSLRLHGRALRRGTWRIVVRPSGDAHWVRAAAVLSG